MADMLATYGLDDSEFRAGLERVAEEADHGTRRVETSFDRGIRAVGRFGRQMLGIAGTAVAVRKGLVELDAAASVWSRLDAEAGRALDTINKRMEMQRALLGPVGQQWRELKAAIGDFVVGAQGLNLNSPGALAEFRRSNFERLDRDAHERFIKAQGDQFYVALEQERKLHQERMDNLKAEMDAGRLTPDQFRSLRAQERGAHQTAVDRLIRDDQERRAREEEAERRRREYEEDRAQRAARERGDALFGLDMSRLEREAEIARARGQEREAAALERKLDLMRRIREIEQHEALRPEERARAVEAEIQAAQALEAAEEERAARRAGQRFGRSIGAGAGGELSGLVFGPGRSETQEVAGEVRKSVKQLEDIKLIIQTIERKTEQLLVARYA